MVARHAFGFGRILGGRELKLALPPTVGIGAGLGIAAIAALLVAWKTGALAKGATVVAESINPLNPENIAARRANAVVQHVTGDAGATVGTAWFETMNPAAVAKEREVVYGEKAPESPSAWWNLSPFGAVYYWNRKLFGG